MTESVAVFDLAAMSPDEARNALPIRAIERRKSRHPAAPQAPSAPGAGSLVYAASLFILHRYELVTASAFIAAASAILLFVTLPRATESIGRMTALVRHAVPLSILLATASVAPGTRIVLAPFVLLAFSAMPLPRKSVALSAAIYLLLHLLVVLHGDVSDFAPVQLTIDLLQWLLLAAALSALILLRGRERHAFTLCANAGDQKGPATSRSAAGPLPDRRQMRIELAAASVHADLLSRQLSVCLIEFREASKSGASIALNDRALAMASALPGLVRNGDMLGHHDDNVFLQILPDTSLQDAIRHARRLHHLLKESLDAAALSMTIGIAQRQGGERMTMIERAEKALERAKRLEGNRLEWVDFAS